MDYKYKMNKVSACVVTLMLTGCFSSGPSTISVSISDQATKKLLAEMNPSDFSVFYLDTQTFSKITTVYTDMLLVNQALDSADLRTINEYLPSLNSVRLRNYYDQNLSDLMQNFRYNEAMKSFNEELSGLSIASEHSQSQLQKIESHIDKYVALDKIEGKKTEVVQNEIANSKYRIVQLKQELERKVRGFQLRAGAIFKAKDVAYEHHNVFAAINNNCNRYSGKYKYRVYIGDLCFVKSLPPGVKFDIAMNKAYQKGFIDYIGHRFKLTNSSPAYNGTYLAEIDEIKQSIHHEKKQLDKVYGSLKKLNREAGTLSSIARNDRYKIEHFARNKTKFIETFLGQEFLDVKNKIGFGVDLNDPSSPLYLDVSDILANTPAVTLDNSYSADFKSNSSMVVIVVGKESGNPNFPVFMLPEVIDQSTIGAQETLYYNLGSNNTESVSDKGAFDTFVTLVGESYVRWKK
ncbi:MULTISPECIES: hypothetical protein [Vibrio]|nr:hypothetical protein [Vibrio tasmaniensis]TKG32618.1 hypothetical protein FC057_12440 [Vibrio tasmaniensis]TKG41698.1 hypothetical protein FC063_07500 [Vibrio tasmaniensis]TKG52053.1 hypothetical protein FC070_09770 [Vibrio tasmaniensis]TKG54028.1 hypothetical protein FC060_00290 [Vibrio tasmaniensis]TKG54867.1 hypothetical protein FC061_06610 [Vibrio tasmaniensis]